MGDTGERQESPLPQVLHGALLKHQLENPESIATHQETRNAQDTFSHPSPPPTLPPAARSEYRHQSFNAYSGSEAGPSRQFGTSYQSGRADQPPVILPSFRQGFASMIDDNPMVDPFPTHGNHFRQQLPMDRREEAGPSSLERSHSSPGWQTGRWGYLGEPIQHQRQFPLAQRVSSPSEFRMHANYTGHLSDSDSQRTRGGENSMYDEATAYSRSVPREAYSPTEFSHNIWHPRSYGFTGRPDLTPLQRSETEGGASRRHAESEQASPRRSFPQYRIPQRGQSVPSNISSQRWDSFPSSHTDAAWGPLPDGANTLSGDVSSLSPSEQLDDGAPMSTKKVKKDVKDSEMPMSMSETTEPSKKAERAPKKIDNACLNCRSRKIRCSGTETCMYCARYGKVCKYNWPPNRRGPGKAPKGKRSKKAAIQMQEHVQGPGGDFTVVSPPQSDVTSVDRPTPGASNSAVNPVPSLFNPPMMSNQSMLGDVSRTTSYGRDGGTEPDHSRSEERQVPTRRIDNKRRRCSEAESSANGPDSKKRSKGPSS